MQPLLRRSKEQANDLQHTGALAAIRIWLWHKDRDAVTDSYGVPGPLWPRLRNRPSMGAAAS
jgi:hypothetical protein